MADSSLPDGDIVVIGLGNNKKQLIEGVWYDEGDIIGDIKNGVVTVKDPKGKPHNENLTPGNIWARLRRQRVRIEEKTVSSPAKRGRPAKASSNTE